MPDKAVDLKKPLTVASQMILPANPRRIYALIVKTGAEVVRLGMGIPAESGRGIPLVATGSGYEINLTNPWHGEIHAVAESGTPFLTIQEW